MKFTWKKLSVLVFILDVSMAYGQSALTIDESIRLAKANFPLIRQYELLEKSTEFTIANANKAYLPQFSITGIGGYIINGLPTVSVPGTSSKEEKTQLIALAQVNQTIWDGGATKTSREIAKAGAEVEKANIDVQVHAIEERVNQIFFGALLVDEQIKLLGLSKENLELNLDRLKLSNANGIAYRVDVDEVEAEKLRVEQREIEYRFTRAAYIDMLSHLIGKPLAQDVLLQRPVVSDPFDGANNRPELNLFASQTKLVEAQSSMHQVGVMPKVGLLGAGVWITPGAQFAASSITSLAIAGISVSWNTSGLYRNKNSKQLDQVRISRISNERDAFVFSNTLELKQLSAEVAKQRAILEHDTRIVELKTRIHKSLQLKFDNGMCTASDLIHALNNEQEAKSNQRLHEIQLLKGAYAYKTSNGN